MIFNVSGNGGTAMNFRVVGDTKAPSNPKENTIWINTSTTITDWVFSATQPSSVNGRVWISTGTSSSVEFDALKKNSIQVYPISAKQYEGGAWVNKTAMSCQSGKWVYWWSGELYKNGDEYTAVTGGWSSDGYTTNLSNNAITPATKQNDCIYLSSTMEDYNLVGTNNAIDLTKYSKLVVTGEVISTITYQGYAYGLEIHINSKKAMNANSPVRVEMKTKGTFEKEIPISGLDEGFVIVSTIASSGISGKITSIVLR